MEKKSTSIIFSIGLFVLINVLFIIWQIKYGTMFFNETFALLLLTGSMVGRLFKLDKIQIVFFFLFFLALFQLLNYSYTVQEGNVTDTYSSMKFNSLISPIVFLLFILYLIINASVITKLLRFIFKGSDLEIEEESDREVQFYYDKFNSANDVEFAEFFKMYKDYPSTAQEALIKIKREKEL